VADASASGMTEVPKARGLTARARWALFFFKKLIDGHLDVFGNLAQKRWSDISSSVVRNCGLPSVGMFELAVRTPLSDEQKSVVLKKSDYFSRFEDGNTSHTPKL